MTVLILEQTEICLFTTPRPSHCVKSAQMRSSFWSLFSRIWTRENSVFGHFSHSVLFLYHFVLTPGV